MTHIETHIKASGMRVMLPVLICMLTISAAYAGPGLVKAPYPVVEREGCVTFILDMCGASIDPGGAYFAASFQGWDPEPMCDMGGDIWEISYCGIDPGQHEYKFLSGPGGWEFDSFGDDCTNPNDNNNRFVDVSGGCDIEGPWCFNTCDPGSGSGPDDSDPPSLTGNLPDDITVSCDEDLPDAEVLDAEDACSFNCTSEIPEDDYSGFDEDCGIGVVIRTWRVFDCAGNEGEPHSQRITIVDNEAPAFDERVDDITLDCNAPLPPAVRLEVIDNCDEELEFSELPVDDRSRLGPDGLGDIVRSWYVEDCSGNPAEIYQTISLTGASARISYEPICAGQGGWIVSDMAESYAWFLINAQGMATDLNTNNDSLFITAPGIYELRIESGGCEASARDTIEFIDVPDAVVRDTILCSDGSPVPWNTIVLAETGDSVIIRDSNDAVITGSFLDPSVLEPGENLFYIEISRDSLCPGQLDTLRAERIDCTCPSIPDLGDYCIPLSDDTLMLNQLLAVTEPGEWVIEPSNPGVFFDGQIMIVTAETTAGPFTLIYTFSDSLLNANCTGLAPPPNASAVNFVMSNPPAASGTVACNQDTGAGFPVQVDLDTLLLTGNSGFWESLNASVPIGPDNLLDLEGITPGAYSFLFTQTDNNLACPVWTANVTIQVFDCACEPLAVVPDTVLCTTAGPLDMNAFVLAGQGDWSLDSSADPGAELLSGSIFPTDGLSAGEYLFSYTLDGPMQGSDCDSVVTTLVELVEPPRIVAESFDTILCNGPNPQGGAFQLNLFDFVFQGTDDGEWSSADYPGDLSNPFNVDMTGVAAGAYEFVLTTITGALEGGFCEEVSFSFFVTLEDCNCPSLPVIEETSLCTTDGVIDLTGADPELGSWIILDQSGDTVAEPQAEMFSVSGLQTGSYQFVYALNNQVSAACLDRSVSYSIEIFEPLEILLTPSFVLCDSPGFSQAPSSLNFTAIQMGVPGDWIPDQSFSGDFSDRDSVSFEGLGAQQFVFSFIPDGGINPCPVQPVEIEVTVMECDCPNVLISGFPVLCNDNDVFDLELLETPGIVEGSFLIFDEQGQQWPLMSAQFEAAQFAQGIYTIQFIADPTVDIPSSCPAQSSTEITVLQAPEPGEARDTVICQGDDISFDLFQLLEGEGIGGAWTQFSGQPGGFDAVTAGFNASQMPAGEYVFVYGFEENQACDEAFTMVRVLINPLPGADAGEDQVLSCEQSEVRLGGTEIPNSNHIYEWRNDTGAIIETDDNIIMVREAGVYQHIVRHRLTGCESMDQVTVEAESSLPLFNPEFLDGGCAGENSGTVFYNDLTGGDGSYVLRVIGDTSVVQTVDSDDMIDGLGPGSYAVFIQSAGCSSDTFPVVITESPDVSFAFMQNLISFESGENFELNLAETGLDFTAVSNVIWTFNGTELCQGTIAECGSILYTPQEDGEMQVQVFNESGCMAEDFIQFSRMELDNIYIPNIFSPGSPGNDRLKIFTNDEITSIELYRIFDRWGNLVYEIGFPVTPNAPEELWWDGRFNGRLAEQGVYLLQLQYLSSNKPERPVNLYLDISLIY